MQTYLSEASATYTKNICTLTLGGKIHEAVRMAGGGGARRTPLVTRPLQELRKLAAARGIKGRSTMTKAELVAALRGGRRSQGHNK